MVHTDLQERNIILGIEDDSILKEFEINELRNPSRRKVNGDRIIYKSRGLEISKNPGRPVITDFGEARIGQKTYDDDIQPFQYRAPEVIMDAPWSYKVDIWNVGVMWNGLAEIPRTSLEESEENLHGEDKGQFLEFMRKMLKWVPEERSSTKELLQDTWLRNEMM
ncbi:hypothetical protein V491_02231 [Pseudogymnoascus sp. VKM F-3775]|nr:hypothetical protein V491_02231 [Pseudogymnoascus sp. VKM F-3775]